MKHEDIIDKVSIELNIPKEVVKKAYIAYWYFIKKSIESIPFKENITQEDFNNFRTSINIPSLGKFSCTYTRYLGIKNRFKIINNIRNKS